MSTLLQQAIDQKIALGCADRKAALRDIKLSIDTTSLYTFAKMFKLLDATGTAEDFSIEFYTAFNDEIAANTY